MNHLIFCEFNMDTANGLILRKCLSIFEIGRHFSIFVEFSYFYDIITLYKPNIRERKMQDGIS